MRKVAVGAVALFVGLVVTGASAQAGVPERISFQARLADTAGTPVEGVRAITFTVYDAASGGAALWSEAPDVTLSDGYLTVLLGGVTAFPAGLFDGPRWLGIAVDTDAEMTPRFELAAAPYAIRAKSAATADTATTATAATTATTATTAGDADTVDGKHAADFDMPPVAMLTASRTSAHFTNDDIEVTLDASASYDPEGGALSFQWDFLGTGTFAAGGAVENRTHAASGVPYLAAVRVSDPAGRLAESKALVRVAPGGSAVLDSTDMVGWHISLCVVDGRPAISYCDATNWDLKYVRADDAAGSSWGAPVTPDSAGSVGYDPSLCVVDGRPAISYYDGTNFDLKYVRAADASGSSWGAPLTLDSGGVVGRYPSLCVVDGRPAISYFANGDLKYVISP